MDKISTHEANELANYISDWLWDLGFDRPVGDISEALGELLPQMLSIEVMDDA